MYIYIPATPSRWALLHVSNTDEEINGENKRQGRKENKEITTWNFTVPNKSLQATYKVPTTALQVLALISYII